MQRELSAVTSPSTSSLDSAARPLSRETRTFSQASRNPGKTRVGRGQCCRPFRRTRHELTSGRPGSHLSDTLGRGGSGSCVVAAAGVSARSPAPHD